MHWRGVVGLTIAVAASATVLAVATRGFRVFTTDAARADAVRVRPIAVPDVALLDMHGTPQSVAQDGRSTIVDFVYTRCPSLCGTLGSVYQRLQSEIVRRNAGDRVRLLTISFDPAWDTPERLRYYAIAMHPDPAIWSVTTVANPSTLSPLLDAFGVRVLADGTNGFVHNAALHVVNAKGQLVSIHPLASSSASRRDAPGGDAVASRSVDALDEVIAQALDAAIAHAPPRRLVVQP